MTFNIIVGFIIPWIFGIILFFKNKKILLTIFPIASAMSFTIITLELDLGFWKLHPFKYTVRPAILFCLGLFPILATYLIYFINLKKVKPYLLILIFTLMITLAEGIAVLMKLVQYRGGWNLYWTFISYLVPNTCSYYYYRLLKKVNILV